MTWLITTLLKWLSGGMLDRILAAIDHRADNATERDRIAADLVREEVRAEMARRADQKDLALAGMGHPIWWLAWALFALPVGVYHAAIYTVSILNLDWTIQRVPPVQEEWGYYVIQALFLAQAGTGIAGMIAGRLGRR